MKYQFNGVTGLSSNLQTLKLLNNFYHGTWTWRKKKNKERNNHTICNQERMNNLDEQLRDPQPSPGVQKLIKDIGSVIETTKHIKDMERKELLEHTKEIERKKIAMQVAEARCNGEYELGPRLKQALQAELQDVMIKMWQVLPDDANTELEKYVIDKLKGEAGDDFGNVLGLNVTKRILDLGNNLFVKVKFESFISGASLAGFLQRHRVHKAKKVQGQLYTFVAQMRDFADFDALCTATDLVYNKVPFSVEPCYRFMTCPETLRTNNATSETNMDLTKEKKKKCNTEAITPKIVNTTTKFSETLKAKRLAPKIVNTTTKFSETLKANRLAIINKRLAQEKAKQNAEAIKKAAAETMKVAKKYVKSEEVANSKQSATNDKEKVLEAKENYKIKVVNIAELKGNATNYKEKVVEVKESRNNAKVGVQSNELVKSTKTAVDAKVDTNARMVQNNATTTNANKEIDTKKINNQKEVVDNDSNSNSKDNKTLQSVGKENTTLETGEEIGEDFYDMAMLLADSIVLDECSGSDVE